MTRAEKLVQLIVKLKRERRDLQSQIDTLDGRMEALDSELRRAEIELENLEESR